jgi:hypothetical protein
VAPDVAITNIRRSNYRQRAEHQDYIQDQHNPLAYNIRKGAFRKNAGIIACSTILPGPEHVNDDSNQPLKLLHAESSLSVAKLIEPGRISTDDLMKSLLPGQSGSLKTRQDGTVLDGNHRIHILRKRGIDVDGLPREVAPKDIVA